MTPLYFDYAATTAVDSRVAAAMASCLTLEGTFGNPASRSHKFGWQAEQQVETARRQLADCIHCDPREIVFTSGATESNNLAIKGVIEELRKTSNQTMHLITSRIEHKAVLDVCAWLEKTGVEVTYLTPDADGIISPEQVAAALKPETVLVSLMAVNNEIGTITNIKAISQIVKKQGALLHVDGAQALGKVKVDVRDWNVDLLSISAHKFYGPKGIGALFVRREPQVKIAAQMHGGGHERGMRSGTLATHQIVGMGLAAELIQQNLETELAHYQALNQRLWQGLEQLGGVYLNGHPTQRTGNHLNVSIDGLDGEILLASLAKVAVSSGSACNSATVAPSYVLKALGRSDELAHAGLRFSLGRFTTTEQVDAAIAEVARVVKLLRA
ncbi:MAG: aminotransferase class V-fold PLP-dependent enzyme [Venatoribacter sp.]